MKSIPDVIKVMTPFPYTIEISKPLKDAKEMMESHDIGHLPVTENEELAGVVSKRDVELSLSLEKKYPEGKKFTVRDLCIVDPYVVETTEKVTTVAAKMSERYLGAALVVKNKRLVGIFTDTDAYEALINNLLGKGSSNDPPDIPA